jgi:uncharacterized protein YhbP (UPF0306 family)
LTAVDLRRRAITYLEQHHVLTLATHSDGRVWAAAVFYATVDLTFYFLSAPHTRHAREIAANPHVAGTVQEDYSRWEAIQGIQLEGEAKRLHGDEREMAIAHYLSKYPFVAEADGPLSTALARVAWYRLTPSLLYLIDNSQGLGHRDEIPLHR